MNKATAMMTTILLVGTTGIGAASAEEQGAVRSSIGTWKLNLKESIAPQGRQFEPYTIVLRRADDVLDFTYHGFRDGKPFEFSYAAKADGVVHELEGGMRGAMIRLPSGNYEARLWLPDGSYENKFCQLAAGGKQQICLATVTQADGSVVFFKQVQDRQ